MLPFLRSDLAQLTAYTPHPGGDSSEQTEGPQILDRLDTNESPYDLPADLKQQLAEFYQRTLEANRYPDGAQADLKQAVADYVIESANLPAQAVTPAHISMGNGSDELIRSLLIATCLNGAGSILVAQPTFSMYGILAQTLGIPVQTIDRFEASFEMNLAAAEAAIAQTQTVPVRAVFMVHPNSPTGNPLTGAELDWLRGLPDDVLVVIDEAYFEFSQQTVVPELLQRPNWVVLRTFSKAFRLAAHRVGYAIAHPALIAALEKVRLPYNLPSMSQAAARMVLAHRHLLLEAIPALLAERSRLFDALQQQPELRVWPSAANFLFLRFRNETEVDPLPALFELLKAQGTLVRHTSGGLRITVGSPAENQRTLERLQSLLKPSLSRSAY